MPTIPESTKQCCRCRTTKPADAFSACKSKRDGRQSTCKECYAAYSKANRERLRQQRRDRVAADPGAVREYRKRYYREHADEIKAKTRRWSQENPDRARAQKSKWAAENRGHICDRYAKWAEKRKAATHGCARRPPSWETPGEKYCGACKRRLPVEMFCRNRSKKDGLTTECKECTAAYRNRPDAAERQRERDARRYEKNWSDPQWVEGHLAKARERYREDPEKILRRNRESRKRYAERVKKANAAWAARNPQKIKQYKAAYRLRNLDKIRARTAAYYREHPDRVKQIKRKWAKNNPGLCRAHCVARRARMKSVEIGDPRPVKAFYRHVKECKRIKCHYCNAVVPKSDRHVDHMTPLSRGGRHAVDNLCCACQSCNQRKSTKTAEEFTGELLLF